VTPLVVVSRPVAGRRRCRRRGRGRAEECRLHVSLSGLIQCHWTWSH